MADQDGSARRHYLFTLGALVLAAATLQISAGFLPGIGPVLSVFGTLPVLIGAMLAVEDGLAVYFASGLVVLILQPLEAPVFFLTTGLLGLTLGYGVWQGWNRLEMAVYPGMILSIGIDSMTFVAGMPAFGPLLKGSPPILYLMVSLIFGLLYSNLWTILLPAIRKWTHKLRSP